MLVYISGPMFSGKTTYLYKEILYSLSRGHSTVVLDPCNTRNSDRDLICKLKANKQVSVSLNLQILSEPPDINTRLIDSCFIDEWQLFTLQNNKSRYKKFLDFLLELKYDGKDVCCAGLMFDCYSNFNIFPVVQDILAICDAVKMLPARNCCHICGGIENVTYTEPTENNTNIIGDSYYNICFSCKRKREGR